MASPEASALKQATARSAYPIGLVPDTSFYSTGTDPRSPPARFVVACSVLDLGDDSNAPEFLNPTVDSDPPKRSRLWGRADSAATSELPNLRQPQNPSSEPQLTGAPRLSLTSYSWL